MSPNLTLVSHHLCPYVQRAAIALLEKGMPFRRVYVDLDHKPEWFVAKSPLGKTPLLEVDDVVLFESVVICEYLEETMPGPLHPPDALERARHRGWIEASSAILSDVWGLETARDAEGMHAKAALVRAKLERVEQALHPDGPYFAGSSFSLVDAAFAPVFRYFDVFDAIVDLGVFHTVPRVRAWRGALARRPSVEGAVTDDYHSRLRAFLRSKGAYVLSAGASALVG